jgi:hypothetical protein
LDLGFPRPAGETSRSHTPFNASVCFSKKSTVADAEVRVREPARRLALLHAAGGPRHADARATDCFDAPAHGAQARRTGPLLAKLGQRASQFEPSDTELAASARLRRSNFSVCVASSLERTI